MTAAAGPARRAPAARARERRAAARCLHLALCLFLVLDLGEKLYCRIKIRLISVSYTGIYCYAAYFETVRNAEHHNIILKCFRFNVVICIKISSHFYRICVCIKILNKRI